MDNVNREKLRSMRVSSERSLQRQSTEVINIKLKLNVKCEMYMSLPDRG